MLRSICSIYSDLSEQAARMNAIPLGIAFFLLKLHNAGAKWMTFWSKTPLTINRKRVEYDRYKKISDPVRHTGKKGGNEL